MALNFGGLGFSFAGKDDGAIGIAKGVSSALGGVWNQFQKVSSVAATASSAVVTGLTKIKDIGVRAAQGAALAVASAIEGAASPKLSNAFESQFLGFKKSYRAMTVGMNMSAKEAKKMERTIGGVAFGLNEDMDAAATSWVAFRKQNIDLNKVLGSSGTKGAIKDLVKVTTVYGIEGQQLASVTNALIHSFGFTEERVGSLADKVVTAGKMFDMGREAVQAWPGILEVVNKELADFGRKATPEDMENLTTSIVALGGAFSKMGAGPAEGIETAKNVFTTLMGERKNIMDMFRGMGGEMSEFGKRIMESTGNADSFFDLLSKDPAKFVSEIVKVAQQVEKEGGAGSVMYQRLNKTIAETLGPDVAYAIQGSWSQVADKMGEVGTALADPKVKGAFTEFARQSHVTNRTMQESWDLMMQGIEAKLMYLSKDVRKDWVKNMKGGFQSTTAVIAELADPKKSPIAKFTQQLLLAKDVGLSAFFPALGRLSPLFGGIFTSMLPFMTALGAMGIKFGMIGKMAMSGGLLYGVFYLLQHGPEEAVKSLKKLGENIWIFVEKLFPEFAAKVKPFIEDIKNFGFGEALGKWFAKIDWAGIIDKFTSMAKAIGGFVLGILQKIPWDKVFEAVGAGLRGIGKFLQSIDWGAVFATISGMLSKIPWGKMFSAVFEGAKAIITGAVRVIRGFLAGVDWKGLVKGAARGIFELADGIIDTLLVAIGALFYDPATAEQTGSAIQGFLSSAFMSAIFAIKDILWGAWMGIWDYVFSGEGISGKIGKFVKVIGLGFAALMLLSKKFRTKVVGHFKEFLLTAKNTFKVAGSRGQAFFATMRAGARAMGRGVRGALRAFGGIGLIMGLVEAMDQVKVRMKNIDEIANNKLIPDFQKTAMQGEQAFLGIGETANSVFLGLPGMIGEALGISSEDLSNFYYDLVAGAEKAIGWVAEGFSLAVDNIGALFSYLGDHFSNVWDLMKATAGLGWAFLKQGWTVATNAIAGIVDTIGYKVSEGFYYVRDKIEVAIAYLTQKIMNLVDSLPDVIKDKTGLGKVSKSWLAQFEKTGGIAGLEDRQRKAAEARARNFEAGRKQKEQENLQADMEVTKARTDIATANAKMAARTKKYGKEMVENTKNFMDVTDYLAKEADKGAEEAKALSKKERDRKAKEEADRKKKEEAAARGIDKATKKRKKAEEDAAKVPSLTERANARIGAARGYVRPEQLATAEAVAASQAGFEAAVSRYLQGLPPIRVELEAKGDLKNKIKAKQKVPARAVP